MDFDVTLTLLVFGLRLSSCSQYPLRLYHYVNLNMNWAEAQKYCRDKYTDLATFESEDDIARLQPNFTYGMAWIGLWDDPKSWYDGMGTGLNAWRWSATGEPSKTGFSQWDQAEPDFKRAREECVYMANEGKWVDFNCQEEFSSVCFDVTNHSDKTYKFIPAQANWTSAQAYCRRHHTDLATIEDSEENAEVNATKPSTAPAWIGLYRKPWVWSDGTQSSFTSKFSPENYRGRQFCVSEYEDHKWNDNHCHHKTPFICHQEVKQKMVVKMRIKSNKDVTDSAAHAQILQQVEEALKKKGMTDFKLRWKRPPRREEEPEKQEDSGD